MLFKSAFSLVSPSGSRARLSILIFHRVLASPDPLFPNEPDVARFDEMMGWVKQWFNVLPLDEAVALLRCGGLPARAAAITFDDGYADNLTCATPILKKHGLHATFFIATGFLDGGRMWNDTIIESIRMTTTTEVDADFLGLGHLPVQSTEHKRHTIEKIITTVKRFTTNQRTEAVGHLSESCRSTLPDDLMLTKDQLRALRQNGMGIGAHTVNHPILATQDSASARREITESREYLEELLGEPVRMFAYPNGRLGNDYTQDNAEIVKSAGFDAAVSTNWGTCNIKTDPYHLPRFTPWDQSYWRFGLRFINNFFI